MIRMLTGLVFSFVFLGCTSSKYYSKNNIELLEFEKQGDVLGIYYKVPLETMYYSSGVDYLYNDFDKLEIKFVRAKIGSRPKQMVKSSLTKDKSNNQKEYDLGTYYVEVPNHFKGKSNDYFKDKIIIK